MASRKRAKSRERVRRSAAQWLARLKGGEGKAALHLPPDFVLWVFAGLLAHLDRRGDAHVADLAEGALVHGGGLSVHDGTRWQSAGPAHDAALRAIAQAFADLDLTRGRRQDRGAWEMLDKVEAAYTGFCVGLRPDGTESDRDYLDEEMRRLGQENLSDSTIRKKFRANLRRRLRNGSRPGLSLHQRSLGVPDLKAIVVEPNRSPVLGADSHGHPLIRFDGRAASVALVPDAGTEPELDRAVARQAAVVDPLSDELADDVVVHALSTARVVDARPPGRTRTSEPEGLAASVSGFGRLNRPTIAFFAGLDHEGEPRDVLQCLPEADRVVGQVDSGECHVSAHAYSIARSARTRSRTFGAGVGENARGRKPF